MVSNIFTVIHGFFYFLSTKEGVLFRNAVGLLIFGLVSYMIFYENKREKKTEYFYLIMAFGLLALEKAIIVISYSFVIFDGLNIRALDPYLHVTSHYMETLAFILLANAFVYPYRREIKNFRISLIIQALILTLIASILQILWLVMLSNDRYTEYAHFYGYTILHLIQITYLLYPVVIILKHKGEGRYNHSIVLAFLAYAIVPIGQLFSLILYGDLVPKFVVFLNPFPFISVLIFTRVVYLKLVDKAILKDKLKESEEKYRIEKELSEMKDSFVSVVSHELRTPLTSMKLYSKLFKKEKFGKINRKQRNAISIIASETDRLSELINDILNLSKLESKKEPLKISEFDFYKFSKSHHLYRLAAEKGIKVRVDVPKNFVMESDKDKIIQVFVNLMSNAIKFTDKNGVISVIANDLNDSWKITIKDTGRGIPQEQIPNLFDKFFQVENYMTRYKGGTGLGLAIVKKIVELHNGEIKVESEVGKGSSFVVVLPKKI